MSKRISQQEKLESRGQGYFDQGEPEEKEAPESKKQAKYKHKTFLIAPEMVEQIKRVSGEHHVGQNELVRYLLHWSLEQVESGVHTLPLTPKQTIVY